MPRPSRHIDRNATVLRARELRRKLTLPEGLLWQVLRTRPGGFKFRCQHPIDWYVADFYCAAVRLVVEVDGQCHSTGAQAKHDATRDAWLRGKGFRVVRFDARDVMKDLESVVTAIVLACRR